MHISYTYVQKILIFIDGISSYIGQNVRPYSRNQMGVQKSAINKINKRTIETRDWIKERDFIRTTLCICADRLS